MELGAATAVSSTRHSPLTAAQDAKIKKAAAEFESVLLSSLLQNLEGSFAGEDSNGVGGGNWTEFGVQAIGAAMAKSGGIGIARMIAPYLQRHATTAVGPKDGSGFADEDRGVMHAVEGLRKT